MVFQPSSPGKSVQAYARTAGILFLVSMVCGFFGEYYVPTKLIVPGNAVATAASFIRNDSLYRLSFASYLVEAVCDIALTWLFYVLLRPVHRNLAILSVLFGVISTALFAACELFYFAPTFILGGADYLKVFSAPQVAALAMLCVKFYGVGGAVFMVFYGLAMVIRGYLIRRSGYLPKILGVLFAIAGAGFVAKSFLLVLAPAYASDVLMLPMAIAGLAFAVWLLVKGVDEQVWGMQEA